MRLNEQFLYLYEGSILFEMNLKRCIKSVFFGSLIFWGIGCLQSQNKYVDSLNKLVSKEPNDSNTVKSLFKLFNYYKQKNDSEKIHFYLEEVFRVSNQVHYYYGVIQYYKAYGILSQSVSEYAKALHYYNLALNELNLHPNPKVLSGIYNNMGTVYWQKAEYKTAIDYYLKSLKILEELKDEMAMSNLYSNIGVIYNDMHDYDEAYKYYHKSLTLLEKLGEQKSMGAVYGNIAGIFAQKNNQDSALFYVRKGLELNLQIGDSLSLSNSYSHMGNLFVFVQNHDSALKYMHMSIVLKEKLKDLYGTALQLTNIGEIYNRLKKYNISIEYFKKSAAIAKQIDAPHLLITSCGGLSTAYRGLGDYKNAFEQLFIFKRMNDSIFNIENTKQLSNIKTKYEVEKKETEMNALYEKEQQKTEAEIKQQKIIKNSFIIGGILLLMLTFLIYRNLRQSKNSNKIITLQKQEVENQKDLVEEKQKEIVDSINYAKRIQGAMLASKKLLDENLNNYFIFFKPKAIVSGDFYWATKHKDKFYLAACDSTGHGVPGAFMSLLNISCLNEAVDSNKIFEPNEILNYSRNKIIHSLASDGSDEGGKDGMDCILCEFDFKKNKLRYAAANNSFYIVRNGEIITCKADKMPVGRSPKEALPFTLFETDILKGDNVYLVTDGFADQFGGTQGKKFKYKQLEELLIQASQKSSSLQSELLNQKFEDWKGKLEQVDDVCVIGIKI